MSLSLATSPNVPEAFLKRIVDELHPLEIWLFGSRARGTPRPESDWDLMAVLPDTARDEDLDIVPLWERLHDLHAKRVELRSVPSRRSSRPKAWSSMPADAPRPDPLGG